MASIATDLPYAAEAETSLSYDELEVSAHWSGGEWGDARTARLALPRLSDNASRGVYAT